jgi:23S rRNA (adenine2503-C2)-methyltransferase
VTEPGAAPSPRAAALAHRTRYDVDRVELAGVLDGQPRYRVDQVWQGFYEQLAEPAELTTLPKALRTQLDHSLPAALQTAATSTSRDGDTVKWLWALHDGSHVETVLMHYRDRSTVCISTQAGCAMACSFCATGQGGFERNLSVGEIVEQVVRASREARAHGRRVSNIVFMGMGEPFANYDRTIAALERIHDHLGISARHLTVSTVGVVPGIVRFGEERLPANLAVSLHAANDTLRDELVPINRRYPLAQLVEACHTYLSHRNRRLSFEWAMIDSVNDRPSDARELAAIARGLRAHVNLIPLNRTSGYATTGSPLDRVHRFRDDLLAQGVTTTVRQNRGTEIDAACGQLRARTVTIRPRHTAAVPGTAD